MNNVTSEGSSSKPLSCVSLDLDNQWSYMKIHGDTGWRSFPSYLDKCVPLILDLLDSLGIKITFFIVGQDAAIPRNHDSLSQISAAGHEIGNHSFHHEPWLQSLSRAEIEKDVLAAEQAITEVTGRKPVGFRGPGFSWNGDLLEVLAENGYLYDASTLPMYLGPLARTYYFWKSRLSSEEKSQRRELYGRLREGLRPVKPHLWNLTSKKTFLEIPVTTIPIIKLPFHLSYLVYLYRYSEPMMMAYLRLSIWLCQMTKTRPSFLLHPLDFIGADQVPELSFFPGMGLRSEQKRQVFLKVMNTLSAHFSLVNMRAFAHAALDQGKLRVLRPAQSER